MWSVRFWAVRKYGGRAWEVVSRTEVGWRGWGRVRSGRKEGMG